MTASIPTGRRPRALSLTPDGRTLAVANFSQGSVTFLDTQARAVLGHGPTTAVNLRGVAIYPSGRRAYAVGQRAQNERPTESAIGIWSNQSFHVRPGGGRNGDENIWLDLLGADVADPDQVVFDPAVRRAFLTCSGGHSLNVLNLSGDFEPKAIRNLGAMPKGLAFTPDGKELWVACHLGNEIAVVDPESLRVTRRIPLGPADRRDPHLLGRFLFSSATIVKGGQFSCNSCHPDGGTDGISWKFVHVNDELGKADRNVRSLRGEIGGTAPFRWTGHDPELLPFVRTEVRQLLQFEGLDEDGMRALANYVRSIPLAPNPHRAPDGSLTEAARRGKLLFEGKAECGLCHTGPGAGGHGKAWVGTTPEGLELDIPHLAGVFDSYPYLHDGSAPTLEAIFAERNPKQRHGKAHLLTPDEVRDLLQYVREL